VDQHFGLVSTSLPNTIYFCTDGGLFRSRDGGQTFENLNATLTLAQFNGVAFHPTNPEFAMGGTQDNGNLRYTGTAVWSDRTGSDGGFNLVQSNHPDVILSNTFEGNLWFSIDGGDTYSNSTPCNLLMNCGNGTALETMAFYPPAAAAPAAPATVFLGTNRIWANPNFGALSIAWKPRSSSAILTTTNDYFTALAVAGDGSGPVWAGSLLEGVFLSADGGATFSARNNGLPNAIVTAVVAATPDGQNAYATLGGFLGAPSRHVFRTSDGGATWTNISGNLPDVPITSMALDPSDPSDLFVGSDVGVFRSADGGASWVSFNEGLPNAGVYAIAFHPATSDLWAATYGRGMFRISQVSLAPAADFVASPSRLTAGSPVLFVDTSANSPTSWSWNFGDPGSGTANVSTKKNPEHTYAAAGSYTVTLTAASSAGSSQITHTVVVSAGPPCLRCSRVTPFH
jgi:PKD domain-containing protein